VGRSLRVEAAAAPGVKYAIRFVGTSLSTLQTREDRLAGIGETLATVAGESATYALTGDELYIRAIVTSDRLQERSAEVAYQRAWTQPFGWRTRASLSGGAEVAAQ
jgi:hypothetical protein